jgi:hypothetical protein
VNVLEDETANAMAESIRVWQELKKSTWFPRNQVRWILLFTKLDLFEEKIACAPISNTFPNYTGPNEVHQSLEFIKSQFLDAIQDNGGYHVETHYVCGLDEAMTSNVFSAVKNYILTAIIPGLSLI